MKVKKCNAADSVELFCSKGNRYVFGSTIGAFTHLLHAFLTYYYAAIILRNIHYYVDIFHIPLHVWS